ncbi:thermonuclease family protein [Aureimonas glaciei]|uniref:Succinoglycan biosynthesis protein n=1 Tax=Aureimonas glaciei TaxID=1776957 RepID=A0A916XXS6_9HYPH|nr:thermonuclease family protein [Aureimonas glaciei]GGD19913.1 succinoglycan biosynthesis protein [Aureimonas glaciei]
MFSKLFAFLIILQAFILPDIAAAAASIEGRATVVDGDTVAVEGTKARIRLYGVDTPEGQQTCADAAGKRYLCGSKAADFLSTLIGRNGRLVCTEIDRDRYGRIVAECRRGDVVVNAELVRAGWALEYKAYSDGRYSDEEREARAAKVGLWQGRFVEPAKWRRGDRLSTEAKVPTGPGNCQIKGNISGSGRIFHLPGSRAYPKTKIDESAGERWFCSEAEAVAAGWRAVRG